MSIQNEESPAPGDQAGDGTKEQRSRSSTHHENDYHSTAADRLPVLLDLFDRGVYFHELHRTGPDGTCHCPKGRRCGTSAGKHPKPTQWQHGPGLSREEITDLVAEGASFGVRTGDLRDRDEALFVVDIDGPTARNLWDTLVQEHGDPGATFAVTTPREGGLHLYFLAPGGTKIKTGTDVLGKGIDVRGHGGQVVAPGTTIRNYKGTGQDGVYSVVNTAPFAEGDL